MDVFTCTCDWRFIITRKEVYGPIFKNQGSFGHSMSYDEFKDYYSDCEYRYTKKMGTIIK